MSNSTYEQQLRAIADALAESVDGLSDEQIRRLVQLRGDSPRHLADQLWRRMQAVVDATAPPRVEAATPADGGADRAAGIPDSDLGRNSEASVEGRKEPARFKMAAGAMFCIFSLSLVYWFSATTKSAPSAARVVPSGRTDQGGTGSDKTRLDAGASRPAVVEGENRAAALRETALEAVSADPPRRVPTPRTRYVYFAGDLGSVEVSAFTDSLRAREGQGGIRLTRDENTAESILTITGGESVDATQLRLVSRDGKDLLTMIWQGAPEYRERVAASSVDVVLEALAARDDSGRPPNPIPRRVTE
jgi:hypothetical protein